MSKYTIVHRKRGERRSHRCGYRTEDIALLREIGVGEIESGEYVFVKIIDADSEKLIELLSKATR